MNKLEPRQYVSMAYKSVGTRMAHFVQLPRTNEFVAACSSSEMKSQVPKPKYLQIKTLWQTHLTGGNSWPTVAGETRLM
jgi:hypothetical protein